MNEITFFENEQFGTIRTLSVDGEPWFVAADVCRALDIKNSRDAIARLDDDEKGVALTDTLGGKQEMSTVNESGLYALVLGSRKPEAKQFKRWITHEVIPAIRRTGAYSVKPMSQLEIVRYSLDKLIEQEQQILAIREEQESLNAEQESMKSEQTAIRDKVDDLETKFEAKLNPTVGMDWYTVTGYASLKNLRVSPNDYSSLGKLATKLSKERGYPMGSAPHPVYGKVHTYHLDILEEAFERYRRYKVE